MKSITRALEKEVLRTGRTEEGGVISSEIDGGFSRTLWYIKRFKDLGPEFITCKRAESLRELRWRVRIQEDFLSAFDDLFRQGLISEDAVRRGMDTSLMKLLRRNGGGLLRGWRSL